MIPYGRQSIHDDDIRAVESVLRSDFLTQGPAVPRFEQAIASRCGAAFAVASNSATSSLHIACLALGLGPGDRLWTSPTTFVASANCGLYCGASVDFVDIDPATACMDPAALEAKLVAAERDGTLPDILIPVHLAGQPCDMAAIGALARRFGVTVIEDASHAVGATIDGVPVGSGRDSAITIFSFHPVKIMTSGEGGMALTNDPELARRMALLRSHGITRDPAEMALEDAPGWHYEQVALGFNYRMTDIHAALGSSQLGRLDAMLAARRAIADRYDTAFAGSAVQPLARRPGVESSWHLYVVRVAAEAHRETYDRLRTAGIGVNLHYTPVHLQPYYRGLGFSEGQFPAAEEYAREAISLPIYPDLTESQQDEVIKAVKDALSR